jgi:hypothetical protein
MIKSKKNIAKYLFVFIFAFIIGTCFSIELKTTEVYYKVYPQTIIVYAGTPTGFSLRFDLTGWLKYYQGNDLVCIEEIGSTLADIGKKYTVMKLTGNLSHSLIASFMYNLTYIALGTDEGLTASSTVLPNEWNRTLANQELLDTEKAFNLTATIYPSGSGSTNSTSINWKSGIGTANSMWCYDTFITKDYTSNDHFEIEWQVTISYT